MKTLRIAVIASATALIAACSTAPNKPEAAPAAKAAPAAPAVANIAGSWIVTTDSQMGSSDSKMSVVQNGKDISGVLESPMGSVDYKGTIDGNNVKFGFMFSAQGTDLQIDYIGVLENGIIKGKAVFGTFGEGTFTAKKSP